MSLKGFHFVFILASITLCAWISAWGLGEFRDSREVTPLVLGIFGIIGGLGLVAYLGWFLKKLRGLSFFALAFALLTFLSTQDAFACSVCFGNANSPLVKGAAKGILLLMGVIGGVLACFASVFIYWGLKARRLAHG